MKKYDLGQQYADTMVTSIFIQIEYKKAYLGYSNLAEATRFIANELFTEYGLVIIDADDVQLKKLFILQRE